MKVAVVVVAALQAVQGVMLLQQERRVTVVAVHHPIFRVLPRFIVAAAEADTQTTVLMEVVEMEMGKLVGLELMPPPIRAVVAVAQINL